jgi:hypothetical protein
MEQPAKLQRVFCDWQVPWSCWQIPSRKDESRETETRAYLHLKRSSSIIAFAIDFPVLDIACLPFLGITCPASFSAEAAIDGLFQQRLRNLLSNTSIMVHTNAASRLYLNLRKSRTLA